METDDSFNPFASSSRRFSSDIFNEQQSSDSFFVTKNKSQVDTHVTQSNLGSIKEIPDPQVDASSYSNVEITPSGNVDDLFSDSTISVNGDKTRVDEDIKNGMRNILKDSRRDKKDLFDDLGLLSESKNEKVEEESHDVRNVDLFEASGEGISKDIQKDVLAEGKIQVEKVKPSIAIKPNLSSVENKNLQKDQAVESLKDSVSAKIGKFFLYFIIDKPSVTF